LIENEQGLAGSSTRMVFTNNSSPYEATYSGPNVSNGHVLASYIDETLTMIYHAFTAEGQLVAGKATVELSETSAGNLLMQLNWQWLTDDKSTGISKWREINT